MSRLDRLSNTKVANIAIVVGLVLIAACILNGLLNAYSFQYYASGSDPALKDRLEVFLNSTMNSLPMSALVVAAGFALRMLAQRTALVATSAAASTRAGQFEDVPEQSAITVDPVSEPTSDDFWRR
jgi:hypothetical protein